MIETLCLCLPLRTLQTKYESGIFIPAKSLRIQDVALIFMLPEAAGEAMPRRSMMINIKCGVGTVTSQDIPKELI